MATRDLLDIYARALGHIYIRQIPRGHGITIKYASFYRVVKRSSYCLNCVIISAILMGFIGTALYTIEPDDHTGRVAAALLCNVRKVN